ncbi:Sugar transport protein 13 [Heracleum sosnowskyi]|uniref:Sugar transport protein 13 n=1 Tax=Heracleum sosnowskyi TaxID=360622 RepID=A0AAD8GNS6_9APIA|nr:Sugar transport protein 13 [Heracleum sosnowskyi]
MAGGGLAANDLDAKITPKVVISCIMAATGGLMFGYDIGVSGGVTSMDDFLKIFFPQEYRTTQEIGLNSNYCKYNNQGLQLFSSSLYQAALVATFFASYTTRKLGRRFTMLIAGIFFIVGVVFTAGAFDMAMLIFGRIALGCGVGFANQAIPLLLSEIAPTRVRGGLNILFQLNITIGILFANLVSYGTSKIKGGWNWRLSLGLAGIPALLITAGSLLVLDTPNSLIERGKLEEGKMVLKKIRGVVNVEHEFEELVEASRVAKEVKQPFRNLLMTENRPQLVITVALQIFQQLAGINAIMFYAPVLFNTLGFGGYSSLYSAVIVGSVNVLSTVLSIYLVDKLGRRFLLLEAGWLIPSESFPLEMRSAGQSVSVCVNMLFTAVIAQTFLSMLCTFKYRIFLFFSGWVLVMTIFTIFFIPETKNVPIEEMTERVWKQHWYWKRATMTFICNEATIDQCNISTIYHAYISTSLSASLSVYW